MKVDVHDYGDHKIQVNVALQRLKKELKKENFMQELRRREYYMSPSAKKKYRKNEALKRLKREEKKQSWYKARGNSR